jgi:C4-dicarboxylate transporter, DctQ subunit
MVGIIFVQFVLQAGFHISVPWAQETALNLMIWLTCFGASAAVRNRRHIALELLGRVLPPHIKLRVASVMYALSAVFCLGAAWMGAQFTLGAYKLSSTSLVSRIPMWIIYSALPVAAIMLAIRFALLLFYGLESDSAKSAEGIKSA